LGEACW